MVFGLVWIITAIFPKIHPTVRCWLWRIVYLKLLVSFLVVPFRIPHFTPLKEFPVPIARFLNIDPVSQLISTIPIRSQLNQINPPVFFRLELWFSLWILGIGLFGAYLVLLWHRNRVIRKDFRPCMPNEMLQFRYLKLCSELKIQKPPRLLISGFIDSPVLHGIIHSQIILPEIVVSQYTPDEIQVMLAHELAHFKRRDLFWNWLPLIVRTLFFFTPWFGWRSGSGEIGMKFAAII
jgi:beta-lactamase regulating signal transducer with metallopeptidase domain